MKMGYKMTATTVRNICLLGLVAFLGGCASPDVRFHTLMPPPGQDLRQGDGPGAVEVEPVLVPAPMDRSELVVRQGDTGLVVLSSDWWGATLAEEIRSALVARLAAAGAGGGQPLRLSVRVTRFDTVAGEGAWLSARYRLESGGAAPLRCSAELHTLADGGVETLVAAQQANVAALADQILTPARSGQGRCPGQE